MQMIMLFNQPIAYTLHGIVEEIIMLSFALLTFLSKQPDHASLGRIDSGVSRNISRRMLRTRDSANIFFYCGLKALHLGAKQINRTKERSSMFNTVTCPKLKRVVPMYL